ncbi:MAG: putative metal-dependent hydrolase [Gemmatimonadota bacterium]
MQELTNPAELEALRYPVGRRMSTARPTAAQRAAWLEEIAALPARLVEAVGGLDDGQLDTPYRPGGWTVRQVVHHLPDSHANGYVRCCLALTEENPTIRPYDEGSWAELPFAKHGPIQPSLDFLAGVHARWVATMGAADEDALARTWTHPAEDVIHRAGDLLELYAWHSRHHLAHITRLAERMGW